MMSKTTLLCLASLLPIAVAQSFAAFENEQGVPVGFEGRSEWPEAWFYSRRSPSRLYGMLPR